MNNTRAALAAAVVLAGIAASGIAYAQAPASPPATTLAPASSKPTATTQVENWTKKQWDAAKKEWAKDKEKWAACQKQSKTQKLSGRKSWSFLYRCMTG